MYGYVLNAYKIRVVWVIVEAYVCMHILIVINKTRKNDFDVLHAIKQQMWMYIYNLYSKIYVLCLHVKHNICIYKHDVHNLIQNII